MGSKTALYQRQGSKFVGLPAGVSQGLGILMVIYFPLIASGFILLTIIAIGWVVYLSYQPVPTVIEIPWFPAYVWQFGGVLAIVIVILLVTVLALLGGTLKK